MSLFNAALAACVVPPHHSIAGASPASARLFKIICLLYLRIGVRRLSGGLVQKGKPPIYKHTTINGLSPALS